MVRCERCPFIKESIEYPSTGKSPRQTNTALAIVGGGRDSPEGEA